MNDADVVAILARADAAADLPQLGGMARPGGVAIVSKAACAFASVDGGVAGFSVRRPPAAVERIPLVRGLVSLAYALLPLVARRAATTRRWERPVLAVLVVCALPAALLPHAWGTAVPLVATAAMLALMFRGRTLFLHGAEHRAIAAAESRSLVRTWNGEATPSRFAARCGTNFAALAVLMNLALGAVVPLPVAASAASLVLTTELWRVVQKRIAGPARVLLLPGLALQRLTTREPTLAETRIALRAVAAVLRA